MPVAPPPRSARHLRPLAAAFALAASASVASSPARADLRVATETQCAPDECRYLDLGAYVQPGFIWRQNDDYSPLTDDGFWLQRARLGARAGLHKYLSLRVELDMTPNPVLQDAYLETRLHPALGVRFGQLQLAFLRTFQFSELNLAFNDRLLYTPLGQDRPYLRYLSPRDIGLMFNGFIGDTSPKARSPVLQYWVGAFLGRGPNQTRNDDEAYLYSARVQLHALGVPRGVEAESDLARNRTPRVAVAGGVYSNCDDRGQWNRGFTADAELRYRGLFANATLVWFKNGASSGLGDTLGYGDFCPGVAGAPDHIASGASAQLQYVLPESLLGKKQAIELLGRFDAVSPLSPCDIRTGDCAFLGGDESTPGYAAPADYNDADNAPSRRRLTFGVNWFPTSKQTLRVSLNYQMNRETEDVLRADGRVVGIKNDVAWLQVTAGL